MEKQELAEKHSFIKDTIFRLKTTGLTIKRGLNNLVSPVKKFNDNGQLINQTVIAFSQSDLWNPFDNEKNWILTAGKIENLRIAAKKLNGLEIKANEVFSFWRHIGNPNLFQGYVVGREIREGCIVPTVAGGLCQLSNALYDAALHANFDIVERHKHTKVIKGSLAESDRDATVKWNYEDLRFKSNFDFRIETELTADKLIVRYKSQQKNINSVYETSNNQSFDEINDCYSCGNLACFKHPDRSSVKQEIATTTFILDESWSEFDDYISSIVTEKDRLILPLKNNRFLKTDRYNWKAIHSSNIDFTKLEGIYRALKLRFASKQNNVFQLMLALDKKIAIATTKKIKIESTHLVISQNLLPFIYETGILGGRTFDVLMNRLPIQLLHERLDYAHSKHPQSLTLNDFRASRNLIALENKALNKARKIITPHAEIASIFNNKAEKLNWHLPIQNKGISKGSKILFPASAVGRKGAYEVKRLVQELDLEIVVSGRAIESDDFWKGLKIEKFDGNYDDIGLVIYPTYIENQPRQILKAISKGIPVITTFACGIDSSELVKIIGFDDFDSFKMEVSKWLEANSE